jgi:hypothetical protein
MVLVKLRCRCLEVLPSFCSGLLTLLGLPLVNLESVFSTVGIWNGDVVAANVDAEDFVVAEVGFDMAAAVNAGSPALAALTTLGCATTSAVDMSAFSP